MLVNLVISEICCIFIVLKYKELQTKIAIITEDKVTELFCMADDLAAPIFNSASFFDAMMAKYTLKPVNKRKYHRDSTMSKAEVMLIMILFHDSERSRHRCPDNFMVNPQSAPAAYCCFPKKPCIKVQRNYDIQPSLF